MSKNRLITIRQIEEDKWVAKDLLVSYSDTQESTAVDAAINAIEVADAWYTIEDKGTIDPETRVKVWTLNNSKAKYGLQTYSIDSLLEELTQKFPLESERLSHDEALAWVHVSTILKPGQEISVGSWTIGVTKNTMKRKDFIGDFKGWEIKDEFEIAQNEVAATKEKKV